MTAIAHTDDLNVLLRAEPTKLSAWLSPCRAQRLLWCLGLVTVGAGLYGAVIGSWREPLQALYTGIKLPLVILLTTLGNALLNAMLAPLLGLNFTFRQTLMVVLMTFTIAAVMLGAFSPIAAFVVWNTPPLTAATRLTSPEYGLLQLTLVLFLAISVSRTVVASVERQRGQRAPSAGGVAGRESSSRQPNLLGAASVHLGPCAARGISWAGIFARQLL
jgi:hypothetical protein